MYKRYKILLPLFFLVFLVFGKYCWIFSSQTSNNVKILKLYPYPKPSMKTVLFFTRLWSKSPTWGSKNKTYGIDVPESADCPYINCIFTHDLNYLKNITDYDALIFHRGFRWFEKPIPKKRSPHQHYIMFTYE